MLIEYKVNFSDLPHEAAICKVFECHTGLKCEINQEKGSVYTNIVEFEFAAFDEWKANLCFFVGYSTLGYLLSTFLITLKKMGGTIFNEPDFPEWAYLKYEEAKDESGFVLLY